MATNVSTYSEIRTRRISIPGIAVLMGASAIIPFFVHLLPSWDAAPLGAHLLPMFWTTFLAAYFFGPYIGSLTGVVASGANLLMTGLPAWANLSGVSFELVVFAFVVACATKCYRNFWVWAPIAYVAAKLAVSAAHSLIAIFGNLGAPVRLFHVSLVTGLAGIFILAVINFLVVKLDRRGT